MTTASWSSRVRHDSDAVWQEWRDEFITKLGVLVTGGVLAADETNITPGSGARAAINTEANYAVYHISDSLHGTAPIYIRFGFGTGNTNCPRIQITTGTSTNGSGVLGGTALSTIASVHGTTATQTSDTARASYFSAAAGFFGFSWKVGASSGEAGFWICRTVDSDGAITATGAIASWGNGSAGAVTKRQAFRFASTAAAYTAQTSATNGQMGFSPQNPTGSAVGADFQIAVGWTITPRVAPIIGVCGVYVAEFPEAATFTATLVGTTSHTYLTLSSISGGSFDAPGSLRTAMLWE